MLFNLYVRSFNDNVDDNDNDNIAVTVFGVCAWAAQPGGVGGQCPPTFGTSGIQGGTEGRSNENDFCFYSRQSLFSTVQVTEFQLP